MLRKESLKSGITPQRVVHRVESKPPNYQESRLWDELFEQAYRSAGIIG
jgi:hypothetical protein